MHIPDGAMSPVTSLAAAGVMLPVWGVAASRVRAGLADRQVPLLAVGSAFCFTVMMFNIPVPGGTTVHPVGAVLLAVLLGPWAAVLGVTVALAIQALFFADGGVLALGANAFTMAFAMPLAGYAAYRVVAGRAPLASRRRVIAAGVGGYLGVNVAALLTALLLGLQPLLFHDATGRALYFPYGLAVTVPALMIPHLLLAGVAEGMVTAAVAAYLQRAGIGLHGAAPSPAATPPARRLLWALAAVALLSPLGLLATGDAWGEWSLQDLARRVGYAPAGMARAAGSGLSGSALLPDYLSERGAAFYILAAFTGIALILVLLRGVGFLLVRRTAEPPAPSGPAPQSEAPRPGALPEWLRSPSPEVVEGSARGRADFVDRTLAELATAARDTVYSDRYAGLPGAMQRLSPGTKVVGVLALVLLASWTRQPGVLLALYALALVAGVGSRIPLHVLLRRGIVSVAVFAGPVLAPSALNLVTPGPAALTLHRAPELSVTWPGLATFGLLLLRIAAAVSWVSLLQLTTRWHELLNGLRVLGVPRAFVVVLAMTYRYLGILANSAVDMFSARKSRTLGRTPLSEQRRFVGSAAGALFGKTLALTDEVHAAMLSRGWTGEARALSERRVGLADLLWLAGVLAVCVWALALRHAGVGR